MEYDLGYSLSLAVVALGPRRRRASSQTARPPYVSTENRRALHQAVSRTLQSADDDYLRGRSVAVGDLIEDLRSSRKEFLLLYLQETKAEFGESTRLVRQFAADTDAPDLAIRVLRQSIAFHWLWWAMRLSLVVPLARPACRLAERFVRISSLGSTVPRPDEAPAA